MFLKLSLAKVLPVLIIVLAFTGTLLAQSSALYQLPGGPAPIQQQLHDAIKKETSTPEIQKSIYSRYPNPTGELMVLVDPPGEEPFFWIVDQRKVPVEVHPKMASKNERELHSVHDLSKIYFRDTLVIIDTLLIDFAKAKEASNYDSTKFYFKVLGAPAKVSTPKTGQAQKKAAQGESKSSMAKKSMYRIPHNQYQKLLIKRNLFDDLAGDFFTVQLYHESYPDKPLATCALYFPSADTKAKLTNNATFLKNNGYTLPDITSVVSMDLDRYGHVSYRLLFNWLKFTLKMEK